MVGPDPIPALEGWGGFWGGASCSGEEAGEYGGGFPGPAAPGLVEVAHEVLGPEASPDHLCPPNFS